MSERQFIVFYVTAINEHHARKLVQIEFEGVEGSYEYKIVGIDIIKYGKEWDGEWKAIVEFEERTADDYRESTENG